MLFGTSQIDKQHFTVFGASHSASGSTRADTQVVKMMNPMDYIGNAKPKLSKHWCIRYGTEVKDTGLAISVMLGTLLAY